MPGAVTVKEYTPPVPVEWTVTVAVPPPAVEVSVTAACASLKPAKSMAPVTVRVQSLSGVAPPSVVPRMTILSAVLSFTVASEL